MADKNDQLLIAAIDFGTTHSGYAFSFEDDYKMDPLKIFITPNWKTAYMYTLCLKAPTCVLLSPRQEFIAFGYEAEDMYSELVVSKNQFGYFFFTKIKMVLYTTGQLSKSKLIKDDNGKEAPALDMIVHVIRYLKDHLLSTLNTQGITVNNKDIHWVLPVPAIWTVSAKQFMREAANKAGILTEQLTMCLDSEAAALYCQRIPSTKLIGCPVTRPFLSFSAGEKFMIIDMGGERVHISIYQKQSNGTYKELNKPTGGPWGGTKVNEAFQQMMIEIVGANIYHYFKESFNTDYLEIQREFENRKKTIKPESNLKFTIKIPTSLTETFEEETGENTEEVIKQTQYARKMKWRSDKLRMDANVVQEFFRKQINMLVVHLRQLMTKDDLSDVSTLLMVGGFSESPITLDIVRNAFPTKRIIVPEDAGVAMVKGAVMFGHQSSSVLEFIPPGLL